MVAPGSINTPSLQELYETTEITMDEVAEVIPMRRLGRPEEVIGAVKFLLGPESSYITVSIGSLIYRVGKG